MLTVTAIINKRDRIQSPASDDNSMQQGQKSRPPSKSPWTPSKKPVTDKKPGLFNKPMTQPKVPDKPQENPQDPASIRNKNRSRSLDVSIRRMEKDLSNTQDAIQDKKDKLQQNISDNAANPSKKLPTTDHSIDRAEKSLEQKRKKLDNVKDQKSRLGSIATHIKKIAQGLIYVE